MMRKIFGWVLLAVWFMAIPCFAQGHIEQPKPMADTFVHDFAVVIPAEKKTEIQAKAQQLKDRFSTEIAIVTIDSLQGEESFDYSVRMARSWGIGSKDNDVRGLLILVAVNDRKTALRTSRHIEGELPDGVTGEISRQMNEYFKKGDFGGGLSLGMSKILERLSSVYEPPESKKPDSSGKLIWIWVSLCGLAVGVVALLFIRRSRRRAAQRERRREQTATEARRSYFEKDKPRARQTGNKTRQQKLERQQKRRARKSQRTSAAASESTTSSNAYDNSSSSSSSSYESSSSYDSGSSSSSDSGSSYSGGSDFGGGGSDSSW